LLVLLYDSITKSKLFISIEVIHSKLATDSPDFRISKDLSFTGRMPFKNPGVVAFAYAGPFKVLGDPVQTVLSADPV